MHTDIKAGVFRNKPRKKRIFSFGLIHKPNDKKTKKKKTWKTKLLIIDIYTLCMQINTHIGTYKYL